MIDAIMHAKIENKPLMILSTHFSTTFDPIILEKKENSLRFHFEIKTHRKNKRHTIQ